MFFSSSQIYLSTIFYTAQSFVIVTKNINAAHTPTEMKQNLLHLIFSRFFVRSLNLSWDQYSFSLSHLKSIFSMIIESEQQRLYWYFLGGS